MKPLECSGLAAGYDEKIVLSGVSMQIDAGQVVALLGPNGGGKSTLMKTLCGLIPKVCGGVLVQGDDLDTLSMREIARRIAFVPQEEAWHFAFSVQEVVAMGRLPLSKGYFESKEDIARATEAMREAGCIEFSDAPVTKLSGGERQRVLLARALAQDAPILFLDEPTNHLDPQYQRATVSLLRKLAKSGKSLLVAVHDLTVAAILADRAILIADGQASPAAPTEDILQSDALDDAYRTEFDRIRGPNGRLLVIPKAGP